MIPMYGSLKPIEYVPPDEYHETRPVRFSDSKKPRYWLVGTIVTIGLFSLALYFETQNSSSILSTLVTFRAAKAGIPKGATGDLGNIVDPTDVGVLIDNNIDNNVIISNDKSSQLSIKMSRAGYAPLSIKDDILYYSFLADFDTVIEPWAAMQLCVSGYTNASIYYNYTVCPMTATAADMDCKNGVLSLVDSPASQTVTFYCSPFDQYTITVEEIVIGSGEVSRNAIGAGMCMYVRREIRSLTEGDLSNTMDALYTMYSVNETKGKELYGDDYHYYAYALNFHHFNSAWQDADHIHEGNGFLPQHIKMTNIVEKSMQAINPSVTLPYWDFTMDQAEGKSSVSSAVMTPTIFGSMTQPTDLTWGFTYTDDLIENGMIINGRWAYLGAEMNDRYDDLQAGYGYMRAPWNMNPSPYVSRFTMDLQIGISLPSCAQHYEMLQYTDMMSYLYDIQYGPHATTHSLTGGIYGCDKLLPLLEAGYAVDETAIKTICSNWIFYLKEFYRYDYIEPWSNCTIAEDTQSSVCGFTCNEEKSQDFLFNLKNKIESEMPLEMGDDGWAAWTDFICTGDGAKIFSGDHLESASPADPSFWVIHPTLERLTHAKFMSGGFDDESWATDTVNDKVCDKAECYESAYDRKDYFTDCCYGHFEDSQMLDFTTGNKSNHYGDTNGRTLSMTDPRLVSYGMPYIYDSFTWNHCSQDFAVLVENLAANSSPSVVNDVDVDANPSNVNSQDSTANTNSLSVNSINVNALTVESSNSLTVESSNSLTVESSNALTVESANSMTFSSINEGSKGKMR